MQAAEQQVAFWPYAQLLLATHPQGPFRYADRLANFRDVERFLRILLYYPAKPAHDQFVLPLRHAVLMDLARADASDHCFYKLLLEPMGGRGIGDDFRGVLRQMRGCRV